MKKKPKRLPTLQRRAERLQTEFEATFAYCNELLRQRGETPITMEEIMDENTPPIRVKRGPDGRLHRVEGG